MSVHGIIKVSEFFQILIAGNNFTRGYVNWYHLPAVQLDLWGLTQVLGSLSFVYPGCEQRSQAERLWYPLTSLSHFLLAEKMYCKEEQQSDWKIAMMKKLCNIMQNPTIYIIYIWIYVYIYEYMYIFCMVIYIYIGLLGWQLCVHTICTLQNAFILYCHWILTHQPCLVVTAEFMVSILQMGKFRVNSWCVLEQGLNRFSKSWGRYNLSPCCISEYIRRQFRSTDIGWSWTFTSSFVMLLKFLIQIKLKWSCICHHLRPFILLFLFLSQLPLSVFW